MLQIFKYMNLLFNLLAVILLVIGYIGIIRVHKNHLKTLCDNDILTEQESFIVRKYIKYLIYGGVFSIISSCFKMILLILN